MVRELPRRTYPIALTGELEGFHVTMAAMRGREMIAMLRDEMDNAELIEFIVERCIDNDFGVDLRDLDSWMYEVIVEKWTEAIAGVALPPVNGEPSPMGSPTSPSTPTSPRRSRRRT